MKRSSIILLAVMLGAIPVRADVRVSNLFGDGMVMQRELAAPVWGLATPGETVTVKLGEVQAAARADAQGKWLAKLPAMNANTKAQDLIISANNTITIRNVLIGDVWVLGGQSNMEGAMHVWYPPQSPEIVTADYPALRQIKVGQRFSDRPCDDLISGRWEVCTPASVGGYSAVGFFFARRVQQETGMPIGLLYDNWGGTRIEPWIPLCGFTMEPALANLLVDMRNAGQTYRKDISNYLPVAEQWIAEVKAALASNAIAFPQPLEFPRNPLSHPSFPVSLYNAMIHPVVPYGIKGALWYQGEWNGTEGDEYYHKMRALIGGWRKVWNQGDFPFYFVQLPNFEQPNEDPAGGNGWARIRMAQFKSLQIANTGMAVTIDIGEADIHPKNKFDVGERLARWALHHDYGKTDLIASGPLYKSMTADNGRIRISFDAVGGGLMVGTKDGRNPTLEDKNGKLKRFAIAGDDRKWVWADARIDGATVVVSSPEVAKPVAVRYAYSMNPAGCNLYNKEGLPASPFRTDDW